MSRGTPQKLGNLLEKAKDSAVLAVDVFNKPKTAFRSGAFIVLMSIAWLSLLHAIFEKQKISYFYKEKNGRFKRKDGEKESWCLSDSAKKYFTDEQDPIRKNIEFFIKLRNKIEHRFMPEIDNEIFAESQSFLLNFEEVLNKEFGEKHSIADLPFLPLQMFHGRRDLPKTKDSEKIVKFIEDFRSTLSDEVVKSQSFAYKVFLMPNIGNHRNSSHAAIEFIRLNDISIDEQNEIQSKVVAIRDRNIPVANLDRLKPGQVLEKLKEKTGVDKNMHWHTQMWKKYDVRPTSSAKDKSSCKTQYCIYDAVHHDYAYTSSWVDLLIQQENLSS